jgi:hypothetical protein
MPELPKNVFYDFSKFPKGYGILFFPISITRMENGKGQSPAQCIEYIKHFSPGKVIEPKIGLNMVYGDFLYLHSKERASVLKERFTNMVLRHKNGFQKVLQKEWNRFQIQQAFSYEVWSQLYLSYEGDFQSDFKRLFNLYKTDKKFQKYVKQDAEYYHRKLTLEQENFFLEEHLMFYLVSKRKIALPNEHVGGREKWVLWCYPGVPLKGQAYLYQLNPLKLKTPENPFENCCYDLESKKLIDFTRIDLETYNYTYEN